MGEHLTFARDAGVIMIIFVTFALFTYIILSNIMMKEDLSKTSNFPEKMLIFLSKDNLTGTVLILYIASLLIFLYIYLSYDVEFKIAISLLVGLIGLYIFLVNSFKSLLKYYSHPKLLNDSRGLEQRIKSREALYDLFGTLGGFILALIGIFVVLGN